MIDSQIRDLFRKYYYNTISPSEAEQLYHWLAQDEHKEHAQAILQELYESEMESPSLLVGEINQHEILKNIFEADNSITMTSRQQRLGKRWIISIAAAASILVGLAFLGYRYGLIFNTNNTALVATATMEDIPAGRQQATLTLSNGRKISLDSLNDEQLFEENGIVVRKLENGMLSYTVDPNKSQHGQGMNSIETPVGGFYQLILPDGTKVWLNALSSLKFPHTFSSKVRQVELTGEAYFEVAHDKTKPFKVDVNQVTVNVLGTHFNINSYDRSTQVATTVLEGAVSVYKKSRINQRKTVYPGNKLTYHLQNDEMEVTDNVDVNRIIAWKNGFFNTSSITLKQLMDEVSRWYGVDIVYQTRNTQADFVGKLPKDISLKDLITLLELTGELKFNLSSKTLTIMDK